MCVGGGEGVESDGKLIVVTETEEFNKQIHLWAVGVGQ